VEGMGLGERVGGVGQREGIIMQTVGSVGGGAESDG